MLLLLRAKFHALMPNERMRIYAPLHAQETCLSTSVCGYIPLIQNVKNVTG